jgi:thioesterase domain-containing protein
MEIHVVPGNHEDMVAPPHLAALAECLRGCLERLPLGSPLL